MSLESRDTFFWHVGETMSLVADQRYFRPGFRFLRHGAIITQSKDITADGKFHSSEVMHHSQVRPVPPI